jgi:hypothetical protein
MLRWILQDHDHISVFRHYAVNEAVVHAQLSQIGFDQPFWFYVTDQAFRSFFNRDYLRPEDLQSEQLKIWQNEMQRISIPHEMKTQIRKVLVDEGVSGRKFTVRLSCDVVKGTLPSKLLYDYCEMTAYGAEGIFQAIKSSWVSLLNKGFMNAVWNNGLTLADLKVGILVIAHSETKQEGRVYSVSPKCLWDRRHLVLTMTKMQPAKDYIEALAEAGEHAYLVDRETLTVTYYGRDIFGEKTKSRTSAPFDYELIKKVAKQFIQAEKTVGHPMIGEWTTTNDGHTYFNRWNRYNEVPSASFYQETLNSPSRHFWYLMQWSPNGELCQPFWFSLLVKHFRSVILKTLGQTGAKQHLPASYERVLRQTLGILRGRAYLNLGAVHRLLHLAPYPSMFVEVEKVLGNWQKRFDKELRVFWDGPWPDLPAIKEADRKKIRSNYKRALQSVKKNTENFYLQFENEMQSLYDIKWDQRNLSESFHEIREIESRMVKLFSPALFVELEYWSMKSYCHKMCANTGDFSWLEDEDREFIPVDGNWWSRRRARLLNEKWDDIRKSRKKVHQSLFKYFDLFKKRLEVLASKFVGLGILKKASDIFYLTMDEILSFEEGRLMTINLQTLVQYRSEEYKVYAADEKIPQIWLTIGLVGLAEKYQSVISIKDLKHDWTSIMEDLVESEILDPDGNSPETEKSATETLDIGELLDRPSNEDFIKNLFASQNELRTAMTEKSAESEDSLAKAPVMALPASTGAVSTTSATVVVPVAVPAMGSVATASVVGAAVPTAAASAAALVAAAKSANAGSIVVTTMNTPVDQARNMISTSDNKEEDVFKEMSIRNIEM